jgi:cytochrome b561
MLIYGFFLDDIPKAYKAVSYNLHKLTGLTILFLMILRMLWALTNPKPDLPFGTPSWERWAEHSMHFLLYIVVMAMPTAGWIGAVATGKPAHIGELTFELPIAQSKTVAESAFTIHGYLAITIIVLVSLHILAALYHHFIKKDIILRRMMPRI